MRHRAGRLRCTIPRRPRTSADRGAPGIRPAVRHASRLWGEASIAYHEGVPGHHFERGIAKYLTSELSRFQTAMGGTSGYIEGWALYAERLMAELGYLENPDYYLGMLRAQALRSVRVIIDIGMHLGFAILTTRTFIRRDLESGHRAGVHQAAQSLPGGFCGERG